MSDTLTPFLGLTKPGVGGSDDTWGNKLNGDNDKIDANASSANDLIVALTARVAALETAAPAEAIGTVKWWPAPAGWAPDWLVCDGSVHNISDYPTLSSILQNMWLGGDGSTTFALPTLLGRVLVGRDFGLGVLAGQYPDQVGGFGGAATVALTVAQMPGHEHFGVTDAMGDHAHTVVVAGYQTPGNWIQGASGTQLGTVGAVTDVQGNHQHDVSVNATGGDAAHANCQPGAVGIWIIRATIT